MATKTTTTKSAKTPRTSDVSLLRRPRITEKAAKSQTTNTYVFDVAPGATKSEIAKAFHAMYKAKPASVNMLTVRAKSYFKRGVLGFGKKSKKAYITIPKGVTIEIL